MVLFVVVWVSAQPQQVLYSERQQARKSVAKSFSFHASLFFFAPAIPLTQVRLKRNIPLAYLIIHLEISEAQALLRVGQIHPDLARTRLLMHQFLQMLCERRGEELDPWLEAALHSGVPEWRAFVRKLC